MDYVVGSGPAGVACARALLDRGREVTMIDGGITLEPDRAELVAALRSTRLEAWTAGQHAAYRKGMSIQSGELPQKLVYGSDFAYREADEQLGARYANVGLRPSLARGGLSNVWGAAIMPYLAQDLHQWPFPFARLEKHYPPALELTGLAACHDELESLFPLYSQRMTTLSPSAQASRVLAKMEQNRAALASNGIHFGRSRLAVRGTSPDNAEGCVYCRLCMYGCPYEHIYSASNTVTELQRDRRFTYRPGAVVTRVKEDGDGVAIEGHDRLSRAGLSWHGDRVFLAAGAISTTAILLRSLAAYDREVSLKDSQYFLVPLLLLKKVRGAQQEMLHALSQVFIEMVGTQPDEPTVHIQVYSNSDLINEAVAQQFGPLRRPLSGLVNTLQQRLLIAQGFLHSDWSSKISVRLKRDGAKERLELTADINPAARRRVKQVVRRLFSQSMRIGAVPLEPLLKIAEPGRSFHAGGTFPMRAWPGELETDLWGRPGGWKRVHAVDATVFPSIPATTITLSVMANAHRIGWEAGRN